MGNARMRMRLSPAEDQGNEAVATAEERSDERRDERRIGVRGAAHSGAAVRELPASSAPVRLLREREAFSRTGSITVCLRQLGALEPRHTDRRSPQRRYQGSSASGLVGRPAVRLCLSAFAADDVRWWCGLQMPGHRSTSSDGHPRREFGSRALKDLMLMLSLSYANRGCGYPATSPSGG